MGFTYFCIDGENKNWSDLTREERFFCAHLYFLIKDDPKKFIKILNDQLKTHYNDQDEWEAAYEVCFYRDYHKRLNMPIKAENGSKEDSYSQKRTFDLCMFSEKKILIIEAKAQQLFKTDQIENFKDDVNKMKNLLKREVDLIAIASSTYFSNYEKFKRSNVLACFENRHISWAYLSSKYKNDEILAKADKVYKK